MCQDCSRNPAQHLREDVDGSLAPGQSALDRVRQRNHGIEMRAGNGSECKNQSNQRRSRGNSVRKQRDGCVASSEPIGHDSGTDDGRNQKSGPKKLRDRSLTQVRFHCWPILSTSILRAKFINGRKRQRKKQADATIEKGKRFAIGAFHFLR